MPLNLQQKQAVVSEVAEVAASAHSVIAAEYQGLSVGEMEGLRVAAREANVYVKVIKNTLARRAFDGTDYDCMADSLQGQLVFAFSLEEPGSAARVIKDFAGKKMRSMGRVATMAVNAAVTLERPLLIKGEPGTGKTMLAEAMLQEAGGGPAG